MRRFLILCFVYLFLFSYSSLLLANTEIKVNTKQKFEQSEYLKAKDAFILSYEKINVKKNNTFKIVIFNFINLS